MEKANAHLSYDCGQRRFVIARDLYDLHHLVQASVPLEIIRAALPAKFAVKGIEWPESIADNLVAKRPLFASDWLIMNNLAVHLPRSNAWQQEYGLTP